MGITAQKALGGVQIQCRISHVLTPKTSFCLLYNTISDETLATETGQDQASISFISFYLFISNFATEIWDVLCEDGMFFLTLTFVH